VHSVYGQDSFQDTPHAYGIAERIGSGWLVSRDAAAFIASLLSQTTSSPRQLLRLTLQVPTAGSEPRTFSVGRLRLLAGAGAPLPDRWCGQDAYPLELIGQIPNGRCTGEAYWAVEGVDLANIVLVADPSLEDQGSQLVLLAVNSTKSAAARRAPTSAPTSYPSPMNAVAERGRAMALLPKAPAVESADPVASAPGRSLMKPMDGGCVSGYSPYADTQGCYLRADCAVAERYSDTSDTALRAPRVRSRDLYPSANQPSISNSPGSGATSTPGLAPTTSTSYDSLAVSGATGRLFTAN